MLQTTKPIRRRSKQEPAPAFMDPATIKERFYGLTLKGDCLDPVFKNGGTLVVDREGLLEVGGSSPPAGTKLNSKIIVLHVATDWVMTSLICVSAQCPKICGTDP